MTERHSQAPFAETPNFREIWFRPWALIPVVAAAVLSTVAAHDPDVYRDYIAPETGVLETAQFLLLVFSAGLAARLLTCRAVAQAQWLRLWAALILAGAIYVAGEEASWGQHYLGWSTPETWRTVNDQNETNLHNTSSWFDQKPRIALEIAVLFGALLLPLARRTSLYPRQPRIAYLIPTVRCVPAATMVLAARIDDWLADLTAHGAVLFYRPAEVEELFLYAVILIYTTDLLRRVQDGRPPA